MVEAAYTIEHFAPDHGGASEPDGEDLNFETVTLAGLLRETLPQRELILAPIIPVRGLAMLFAGRGTGKTHVGMGMGYAIASGARSSVGMPPDRGASSMLTERCHRRPCRSARGPWLPRRPTARRTRATSTSCRWIGRSSALSINLSKPEHQAALEKHSTASSSW